MVVSSCWIAGQHFHFGKYNVFPELSMEKQFLSQVSFSLAGVVCYCNGACVVTARFFTCSPICSYVGL